MAKIDPKELDLIANIGGPEVKTNAQGNPIAWKYKYLPHWYDSPSEALKENQWEARRQMLKAKGMNEHGQTPDQEKAFFQRKKVQEERRKKAELAAEMTAQTK